MKNCRFFLPLYLAHRLGIILLLALLLPLGSCQKDAVYDVPRADFPDAPNDQSTDRSANLENDVVEFSQWMIDHMVPIVNAPLVYEDIKAGNYNTEQVKAKMLELGFNDFGDFAGQLSSMSGNLKDALQSGTISRSSLEQLLRKQISNIDLTTLARSGGTPGTPCYNQLVSHLAFVAVEVAVAAATGPISAALMGVVGVAAAYIDFKNCLDENYPTGQVKDRQYKTLDVYYSDSSDISLS